MSSLGDGRCILVLLGMILVVTGADGEPHFPLPLPISKTSHGHYKSMNLTYGHMHSALCFVYKADFCAMQGPSREQRLFTTLWEVWNFGTVDLFVVSPAWQVSTHCWQNNTVITDFTSIIMIVLIVLLSACGNLQSCKDCQIFPERWKCCIVLPKGPGLWLVFGLVLMHIWSRCAFAFLHSVHIWACLLKPSLSQGKTLPVAVLPAKGIWLGETTVKDRFLICNMQCVTRLFLDSSSWTWCEQSIQGGEAQQRRDTWRWILRATRVLVCSELLWAMWRNSSCMQPSYRLLLRSAICGFSISAITLGPRSRCGECLCLKVVHCNAVCKVKWQPNPACSCHAVHFVCSYDFETQIFS